MAGRLVDYSAAAKAGMKAGRMAGEKAVLSGDCSDFELEALMAP